MSKGKGLLLLLRAFFFLTAALLIKLLKLLERYEELRCPVKEDRDMHNENKIIKIIRQLTQQSVGRDTIMHQGRSLVMSYRMVLGMYYRLFCRNRIYKYITC